MFEWFHFRIIRINLNSNFQYIRFKFDFPFINVPNTVWIVFLHPYEGILHVHISGYALVFSAADLEMLLTLDIAGWFRLMETAENQEFTVFDVDNGKTSDATYS